MKLHIRIAAAGVYAFFPKCQARHNRQIIGVSNCVSPTEFAKAPADSQCAHCLKLLLKARANRA